VRAVTLVVVLMLFVGVTCACMPAQQGSNGRVNRGCGWVLTDWRRGKETRTLASLEIHGRPFAREGWVLRSSESCSVLSSRHFVVAVSVS
jgi:hypothetical protein